MLTGAKFIGPERLHGFELRLGRRTRIGHDTHIGSADAEYSEMVGGHVLDDRPRRRGGFAQPIDEDEREVRFLRIPQRPEHDIRDIHIR